MKTTTTHINNINPQQHNRLATPMHHATTTRRHENGTTSNNNSTGGSNDKPTNQERASDTTTEQHWSTGSNVDQEQDGAAGDPDTESATYATDILALFFTQHTVLYHQNTHNKGKK